MEAAEEAESWPQGIAAALAVLLDYAVEEPELTRDYLREPSAFVSLFKAGRSVSPYAEDLPETLEEAIVGGIFAILQRALTVSTSEEIKALLPELIEFSLTPYLGRKAALELSLPQKTG